MDKSNWDQMGVEVKRLLDKHRNATFSTYFDVDAWGKESHLLAKSAYEGALEN